MLFDGRFCDGLLAGAVVLPCVDHVRDRILFDGPFCVALLGVTLNEPRLLTEPFTDGGLFCESWFWRAEDIPGLLDVAELPVPLTGRLDPLPVKTPRFLMLFAGPLLVRAGVKVLVFTVCTGMCEAAAAGAVRAMTERFCTEDDGVAI
jgi:hypothetical protein